MKNSLLFFLFTLISISLLSQEICDNGIDDDADGLVDLKDTTDCFCFLAQSDSSISSLIPNPSFEQRTCCPTAASQLNCANNWVQASGATSDYFNTCGLQAIGTFPPPPLPLPDGSGYVGFFNNFGSLNLPYKEYVGTCLTDTIKAGVNYQIEFFLANSFGNLTSELAIYGTTDCANLPFGTLLPTASAFCPTTVAPLDWTLLAMDTSTCSATSWVRVTLNFTATQNYTAIVLGGSCTNNIGSNYYYIDNLILNESSFFTPNIKIVDSGHYCQGNLILKVDYDSIPLSFQWYKDSIALVGSNDSTYSVPNGGTGSYQVQLQYDSGCVITDVYLLDTTIITFDIDSNGSCPIGSATGEITLSNVQNGTLPYKFSLDMAPFITDTFFNNLFPSIYTITVIDSNLCEATKNITVEAFPMPTASFEADSVCLGEPIVFTDNSIITKGTIVKWAWNTPGSPTTQSTTYTYGTDGVYSITHVVVSDSGCIDDTTIGVLVNPLPDADFNYSPKELYTFNPDVCFSNFSTGAIDYVWDFDFSGTTGTSTLNSPCTVNFPADQERTYRVKLVAISDKGCLDSSYLNVIILNEFIFYVPNSFTPNDDNINDELKIVTAGIETYEILIFNKWGEIIFSTNDPAISWDGKHEGVTVPFGSYIYKVNLKGENRQVKELIGHVNVLR